MPSERVQRHIERLLDEADQAITAHDWALVQTLAREVLSLDPDNADGAGFLASAQRMLATNAVAAEQPQVSASSQAPASAPGSPQAATQPSSFVNGRYTVRKFLGEGGKKKVYLAHDTLLDREVAFALIKTEGLDDIGRDRIKREAQAMGRLGAHPHIVSVFDLGEEASGQPYIVTELMGGGDVEGLIEKAPEHRPSLERTLEVTIEVCRGLEFAHRHGIVHRDLKPGNVWLTAEGTAKLGDFGLAVALDKTRLTQAGMMVGTVSYMPPEQATGGEVTPRADLYSLGAMLYEMVTGRPPFLGDDTVAIIGQHLNVAPIAPSWHRHDCPPGLEALILRLLEKDPSRRPASAAEVRQALEGVRAGFKPTPTEENQATVGAGLQPARSDVQAPDSTRTALDNPLYRRVFVGREQETRQLQTALDAALSGQGGLVMLVGEPGIGKTALVEQLATYATLRGAKTLWGHCYEEGSLSLPYLAFVEALRSYVVERSPEALRAELGSAASDLARIVSEVRERLDIAPRPASEPEEDRWRLLQAVSGFLRNASLVQSLVIVLEDLHWADQGTLDLLLHLVRNLAGARLLVIGTYRDVEVDRSHPLSTTLADLRRNASFGRVQLRGLGTPEVQRMLLAITGSEVPDSLAERIHRQTEGNPLFVQEVVRYLVEEGHLGLKGAAGSGAPAAISIPEGLRDVIGRRIARLSPECNRLLAIAAVIGRDFTLATLATVAGSPGDEVAERLAEAVRTAVLTEQERVGEVDYRFAHAFFRQTLYEELGAARRIQIHQQVARALESQYANRLSEHAAELTEHFAHSSDRADLAKAVQYAEVAAERAMSAYAYGEAVRHLEQALDVQEVLDPDDRVRRCDLLLALGDALNPAGEPQRVYEAVAAEALGLAKQLGERQRASHACQQAVAGILQQAGTAAFNTPGYVRWVEEADRYAAPGSIDRVYADCALAEIRYFGDRQEDAWMLLQRARSLAETLQDARSQSRVAWNVLRQTWLPEQQSERLRVAEDVFADYGTGARFQAVAPLLFPSTNVFLAWSDRPRIEEALRRLKELADRTRDIGRLVEAASVEITLLALDGRLEAAAVAGDALKARGDQLGIPGHARNLARRTTLLSLLHLGRPAEALANEAPPDRRLMADGGSISRAAATTLCLTYAGRIEEQRSYLDQLHSELKRAGGALRLNISALVNYLAAAIAVRDLELVASLREDLRGAADLISEIYPTCIARHLAAGSVLLGEREQARVYYDQALRVCDKVHFRPETALTHLQLAELLLDDANGDQGAEALEHLDFAIAEFREMKMQPALERSLRHKEVLKA
jgi:hypothetical protein